MHLLNAPAFSSFVPVSHKKFLALLPLRELIDRGYLPEGAGVREVARFLGVSPRRLSDFRHSTTFKSDPYALAAWLRVGELEARQILCRRYHRELFLETLDRLRQLTRATPELFVSQMVQQCAAAGVAVVIVPEFKGCSVSGASSWLSPARAMIQLSLRHHLDDQFFFSFFHEAGHLLLGAKNAMADLGDLTGGLNAVARDTEAEAQADAFARDFLIPPDDARELPALTTEAAVEAFAQKIQIASGIVAGRLHHDRLLPWGVMARMKRRMNPACLEQGQKGMWATWLTVTQAAELLVRDLPALDMQRARATISEAASRGAFITNCRKGLQRRIEPTSLAAWRLAMRDRDLDEEDREDAA